MLLRDIEDAKRFFATVKGSFAGVGMTAFSRLSPSHFIPSYPIVCLRKTRDIPMLRKKAPVFCLEEALGETIRDRGLNAYRLLSHPTTKASVNRLPLPLHLYPYQSYPELDALAAREGWRLLANPASLRMRTGSRSFFEKMVRDLRLPKIPGSIYPIDMLEVRDYRDWSDILGPRFVVQLPEVVQGGGRGTFFIDGGHEYDQLRKRLNQRLWRGARLKTMSVHQRIADGVSASVTLCVTRHGVLCSGLQHQLTDLAHLTAVTEKGVFCGHVWDEGLWPLHVEKSAGRQASAMGEYLKACGYRGIAGVDFLIAGESGGVFPVEINSRLTGAFPMHSMLCRDRGILPMEVFHLAEFLDAPYEVDVEAMNAQYAKPLRGSHCLVFLLSPAGRPAADAPEPGLYAYEPGEKGFRRENHALEYGDIRNEWEFVLIDGPPDIQGEAFPTDDPLYRLCRLLFSSPVTDKAGRIDPWVQEAIAWAHGAIAREARP
ncbi:MAG: ATP-grasp domain-containing protein [Deltaproteobacteria bacterium]|nr:ATP-grasp domain-containing protein [Deltaproteobacteria bacterium]